MALGHGAVQFRHEFSPESCCETSKTFSVDLVESNKIDTRRTKKGCRYWAHWARWAANTSYYCPYWAHWAHWAHWAANTSYQGILYTIFVFMDGRPKFLSEDHELEIRQFLLLKHRHCDFRNGCKPKFFLVNVCPMPLGVTKEFCCKILNARSLFLGEIDVRLFFHEIDAI